MNLVSRYDRPKSTTSHLSQQHYGKTSIISGVVETRGVYEMANMESQPSISYGYGGDRTLMRSIVSNCETPYDTQMSLHQHGSMQGQLTTQASTIPTAAMSKKRQSSGMGAGHKKIAAHLKGIPTNQKPITTKTKNVNQANENAAFDLIQKRIRE